MYVYRYTYIYMYIYIGFTRGRGCVHVACRTTSVVTWLFNPFRLVSILLGQYTRDLAGD